MTNISEHFSLKEMVESQTARRLKIYEQFNPPADVLANLKALADHILEPLREHTGPIKVNSGYRSPKTNKAVGGAKNSQHLTGEAADIEGIGITNAQLFHKIQELKLPFDQLIWEYGTSHEPAWVHVSYGPRQRRQVLHVGI